MKRARENASEATSVAGIRNSFVDCDPEIFEVAADLCSAAAWLRVARPAAAEQLVEQATALLRDRGRYAKAVRLELTQ
jgi:hypothetical protein